MEDNITAQPKPQTIKFCLCKWWPLLLGPAAMVWVYIAQSTGMDKFVSRGSNEQMALILVGISVVGFAIQAIKYGHEFLFFMLTLCVGFFCREWHFYGTSHGIYVVLAILAVWAVKRRRKLDVFFSGKPIEIWFWTTFSCYLLSQLIARRVFRYVALPRESELHVLLEETVETMAHVVMIITCIISWKRSLELEKDKQK